MVFDEMVWFEIPRNTDVIDCPKDVPTITDDSDPTRFPRGTICDALEELRKLEDHAFRKAMESQFAIDYAAKGADKTVVFTIPTCNLNKVDRHLEDLKSKVIWSMGIPNEDLESK
jgi:hypothetical protein